MHYWHAQEVVMYTLFESQLSIPATSTPAQKLVAVVFMHPLFTLATALFVDHVFFVVTQSLIDIEVASLFL